MSRRFVYRYVLQALTFPVKTFALSTLYAFLSATLAGFALNLFAGVILSENVACSKAAAVYCACIFFVLSSLSFFLVSWLLEDARNVWLAENAPREADKRDFHIEARRPGLISSFILAVVCAAFGCLTLVPSSPMWWLANFLFCSAPGLRK